MERLAKEEGREEGLEEGLEKGLVKGREQGREQGLEKGREQGSITQLLRILTRRCGQLPEEIERDVHRLSLAESQSLGDALFDFQTMDDLKN